MFKKLLVLCLLLCCVGCDSTDKNEKVIIKDVLSKEVQTDRDGNTYELNYYYNEKGLLVKVSGKAANKTWDDRYTVMNGNKYEVIYQYDNDGKLIREAITSYDVGHMIDYVYNDQGQLITEKYKNPNEIEVIEFKYNDQGLLIHQIESTTRIKENDFYIWEYTYEYDDMNRLYSQNLKSSDGWENNRQYEYCENDVVNEYFWENPKYKKLTNVYQYENGNMILDTHIGFSEITYTYDNNNRLIKEEFYSTELQKVIYTKEYIYEDVVAVENPDYESTWLKFSSNNDNANNSADFTNKYGTPTTKCHHNNCDNYVASSGDTWDCSSHASKCLNCGCYVDCDAMYCMDCITGN